jgi:hypothetical protein
MMTTDMTDGYYLKWFAPFGQKLDGFAETSLKTLPPDVQNKTS